MTRLDLRSSVIRYRTHKKKMIARPIRSIMVEVLVLRNMEQCL